MTSTKKPLKKVMEELGEQRIAEFVKALEHTMMPSTIEGKILPAHVIDSFIREAADRARLGDVSLHRVAFELWKRLDELGVTIIKHETCMILPMADIESKLARAVEKKFGK